MKFYSYIKWCKRCGNCIAFCPRQALAQDEWGYPFLSEAGRCTGCGLCEMLCPDFAISMTVEDEDEERELVPMKRFEAAVLPRVSPERVTSAASGEV
ncbi:MAG: 4Fe-4S binding protein [Proteobacteria bacterium]|nr:4Fe-4S binding protein [Pseudomonadota bacterium]